MNTLSPQTPLDRITNAVSFASLLATGDSIASVSGVDCGMAGIVIDRIVNDASSVTFRVSGGIANQTATINVRVVTAQGDALNRSVLMDILPVVS